MRILSFAITIILLAHAPQLLASDYDPRERVRVTTDAQSYRPLVYSNAEQAAAAAQRKYPGKVIKVENNGGSNQSFYRFKMVNEQGKVFFVTVDAQSGRVTKE